MSVSGGAEEEEEFLFGGVDRRVPHPVPRNGGRRDRPVGLVIGTLYGHRRGHVRFAFQTDATASRPAVLVELATPTCALAREMASGLARIALEREREPPAAGKPARELAEEPVWKAYVNGKNCGFAVRRECQESDWKLMRAVQPVSMGA